MAEVTVPTNICPDMFGRAHELALLQTCVDRAHQGHGQVVLISGEAGIGKSRLVDAAKSYALTKDFVLFGTGHCFHMDMTTPYLPLHALLRSAIAQVDVTILSPKYRSILSLLARYLPDLLFTYPELASHPTVVGGPDEEKHWIFSLLLHAVLNAAQHHPLLLIIEDVHWCDDLSLECLLAIIRRIRDVPMLVLVTYRSDEVQAPLRRWLHQIDRERLAHPCVLTRLSQDAIACMVQVMLGTQHKIARDLRETLDRHAEGNPFFLEELIKSLTMTGDLVAIDGVWRTTARRFPVPQSIQETVQQRLAYLSVEAHRLITFAALLGRTFHLRLLQGMMDCDERALLRLLKEVIAAQFVREEAIDRFTFRHALTQEAIIATLLLRERQLYHRNIAEILMHLVASEHVTYEAAREDLAYHSFEGELWEASLTYTREAGEKALALYAQQAAIIQFTRTLDATRHLARSPDPYLLLARGQANELCGHFERALDDYSQALALAQAADQQDAAWQSLLALGFLWTGRDYQRASSWLQQALALAQVLGDEEKIARSLNRLGNWWVNVGRIDAGLTSHHEAFRILSARNDTRGMAETLDLLGLAYGLQGDKINSALYQDQALPLLRKLEDHQQLSSLLANRAIQSTSETSETLYQVIRPQEVVLRDALEALQLARQIGSQSSQAFAEFTLGYAYAFSGDYGQRLAHAQAALDLATTIDHREWMAIAYYALGESYLHLLQPDRACRFAEQGLDLAQDLGSELLRGMLTALYASAVLQAGDVQRSVVCLGQVLPCDQAARTFGERQIAWVWAELALKQGVWDRALQGVETLLATIPGTPQPQPIPYLLLIKGEALIGLGRFVEAATSLEAARCGAEMRSDRAILWRIYRSLGLLNQRLKRWKRVRSAYEAAQQIIVALAETLDEPTLRDHFISTAQATLPGKHTYRPKGGRRDAPESLSIRECEVAVLVAKGKTNREIAADLIVSERTAEAHVSNILGKLGFSSRSQITAWIIKQGDQGTPCIR